MAREIRAFGYHGRSRANAEKFLAGEFLPHSQPGDWLGDGMYFWQDAPRRALEWARDHQPDPAVVGVELILQDCLDLLDITWEEPLRAFFQEYRRLRRRQRKGLPAQTGGYHNLDREVLNFAIDRYREQGVVIRVVRAVFQEGQPIYHRRSALFSRSHVQIAVRDPSLVISRWREGDGAASGP